MELKVIVTILSLVPFLAQNVNSQQFDITKYGAKAGADISQALATAWKEACEAPSPSTVVIPGGTWSLSQVKLTGPCKAPLTLQVQGTVQAGSALGQLPDKEAEWVTINYIDFFTMMGGGVFDGQGQEAWKQNDCDKNAKCAKQPINLSFNFVKHSVIREVTTKDSKNFHVNCISSENVTFQHFTVSAPGDSINTDGIHLGRDSKINILDSTIKTGDDCVSIGDETTEIHITNVTCGPGHGISIGSLGKGPTEKDVTGVYVKNCTFTSTDNGVRVKTWPSAPATLKISELHFEDLIMDNVSNPIIIDQEYCPHNLCQLDKPSLIQISNVFVKNVKGTSYTPEAVILSCSSTKPCENVEVGEVDLKFSGPQGGAITTKCSNVKPNLVGTQNPPVCATAAKPA